MRLGLLSGEHAVCRLRADARLPPEAGESPPGTIFAVTRTADELSVVCSVDLAPAGAEASGPWRALRVAGPLDHGLVGILASLAAPLAEAGVPILAVSTFDTDYLLVPAKRLEDALEALRSAGHDCDAAATG